jgi:hypothetical protein
MPLTALKNFLKTLDMKKRWATFVSLILGKTTLESSAEGVFISEEDMDKVVAVQTANEKLTTDLLDAKEKLDAANADKATAITAKDAALAEKKIAEGALVVANETIATQKTKIDEQAAKILGKPVNRKEPAATVETSNTDEKFSYTKANGFNKKKPAAN